MKVTIDRDECTMCAVCWETCPQIFEESEEDNMSQLQEEYRIDGELDEGEVDDSFHNCVKEAAEGCPVDIIHIET